MRKKFYEVLLTPLELSLYSDFRRSLYSDSDKRKRSNYWRNRLGVVSGLVGAGASYKIGSNSADRTIDSVIKNSDGSINPQDYKKLVKSITKNKKKIKLGAGLYGAALGGSLALAAGSGLGYLADSVSPENRKR